MEKKIKILLDKKLEERLSNIENKKLLQKTRNMLVHFPTYFQNINQFNSNVVSKIDLPDTNIYSLKLEPNYRIIFTAAFDKDDILNIAFLDMFKKEGETMNYEPLTDENSH